MRQEGRRSRVGGGEKARDRSIKERKEDEGRKRGKGKNETGRDKDCLLRSAGTEKEKRHD